MSLAARRNLTSAQQTAIARKLGRLQTQSAPLACPPFAVARCVQSINNPRESKAAASARKKGARAATRVDGRVIICATTSSSACRHEQRSTASRLSRATSRAIVVSCPSFGLTNDRRHDAAHAAARVALVYEASTAAACVMRADGSRRVARVTEATVETLSRGASSRPR